MAPRSASLLARCGLLLALLASPSPRGVAHAQPATNPTVTYGGDLRVRGEALDDAQDLDGARDDAYQYTRMRYRLWIDVRPRAGLQLYFRPGNEYRWGSWAGSQQAPSVRDPESRIGLDNCWVELTSASLRMSLKLGRMDLAYGEGFLIFDGTPADGSSSGFFDAVRVSGTIAGVQVDAFSAKISDKAMAGPLADEDLHGLYARRGAFELYVLERFKHGATVTQPDKAWQVPNPRQRTAALGARWSRQAETGWSGAIEAALQLGRYEDCDSCSTGATAAALPTAATDDGRRGLGGYAHLGWTSAATWQPGFELGGVLLSGDDPNTARYEGWDDFYAEYPKWSELLIYTLYDGTTRVRAGATASRPDDAGAWTNLTGAWVQTHLQPLASTRVTLKGMLLGAAENATRAAGTTRGTLAGARIDCTRIPNVALQALAEYFDPGSYYPSPSDASWYARVQITTSF